jgi:hypothetical protein
VTVDSTKDCTELQPALSKSHPATTASREYRRTAEKGRAHAVILPRVILTIFHREMPKEQYHFVIML